MKKVLFLLMTFCLFTSSLVLGTEDIEDSKESVGVAQEEAKDDGYYYDDGYEYDDDEAIYLNSYDDIYNSMQSLQGDALYREEYERMMEETIMSYDASKRDEVVKGEVIKAEDPETYFPSTGYEVYKLRYQKLRVKILEGEHKGEEYDTDYVLTADSYENLRINPVKVGQKLNMVVEENDGKMVAYATTLDASTVKAPAIFILAIIAIVCVGLFLGKYGLRILPQLILLFDLVLLVFVPSILSGTSAIWLAVISGIAYIIVETSVKVGVNTKMFATIITSVAVSAVLGVALHFFNSIAAIEGITLEIANIVESYPKGDINFYALGIGVFALMMVPMVSNISCQATKVFEENEVDVAKQKIRKYTSGMLPIIVAILLAVSIQKLVYLKMIKYTPIELINSEILLSTFVQMMFLVIAACVTPLVAEQTRKWF